MHLMAKFLHILLNYKLMAMTMGTQLSQPILIQKMVFQNSLMNLRLYMKVSIWMLMTLSSIPVILIILSQPRIAIQLQPSMELLFLKKMFQNLQKHPEIPLLHRHKPIIQLAIPLCGLTSIMEVHTQLLSGKIHLKITVNSDIRRYIMVIPIIVHLSQLQTLQKQLDTIVDIPLLHQNQDQLVLEYLILLFNLD